MRAAVLHEYGSTPVIEQFDEPRPDDEGEVVVDVELAGLNPVDIAIASGAFHRGAPNLPAVVGLEGVGRVAGGPLAYFGGAKAPYGSFAPRALVKRERLIELPTGTDPAQAVAFGIAGQAGWLSVRWRAGLEPGEKVAVLGATGMVGLMAIHAARLGEAAAIVAVGRSPAGLERARAAGATATVELDASESLAERIVEAAGGPVGIVIDMLWGTPGIAALEALGPFGRLIQIGNSAGEPTATVPAGALRGQAREIRGHTNGQVPDETRSEVYLEMCRLSTAGALAIEVEEIPLEDIERAWRLQQQSPGRKLVIRP